MKPIKHEQLKHYVGQYIYAEQKDGTKVKGKLVAVKDGRAYISPLRNKAGKEVQTNWIIGLFLLGVLFFGLIVWSFCCCPGRIGCCGRRSGFRRRRCCCGRFHHHKRGRRQRFRRRRRRYGYA